MLQYTDYIMGVDIGGSHITAGLVDMKTREIVESSYVRSPVDSKAPASRIVQNWVNAIEQSFFAVPKMERRIGIAMPGPFDYQEGISYIKGGDKYEALYGLNIKDILSEKLQTESRNILFLNDAESFLKGEIFSRPELSNRHVVGVTLGTGLGSAIYKNGLTSDAALWQHPLFEGVAEDYISSRWFLKSYFELTGINITGVKELNLLCDNSQIARSVFHKFAFNLSEFLAEFITQLNPHHIILAGNIAKASSRFLPALTRFLKEKDIRLPIDVSRLGEHAPLLGAASLF